MKRVELSSATLPQSLLLVVGLCLIFAALASAAGPAWWQSSGAELSLPQVTTNNGVVTTNNCYAANQGQLKQFTARAVDELNAALPGGAGSDLSAVVFGWQQDYLTNGYATNTANPARPYKPSDYQVVNVGQLKYIGKKVWTQLINSGYPTALPSWLGQSNAADFNAANLGQLKTVFNFDFSLAAAINLAATPGSPGTVNLTWTLPSGSGATAYYLEQQNVDGTWTIIRTLSGTTTSYTVSGLAPGENPAFQLIAANGSTYSMPVQTPADPGLMAPSSVVASTGESAGQIDLSWVNNATNATYLLIEQSTDGVHWTSTATLSNPQATTYTVTNLTPNQSYYFGVAAGNN